MTYPRNVEPSIDELLNDPVTRLLMARDGVSDEAIWQVIEKARHKLQHRTPVRAAPDRHVSIASSDR